MAIVDLRGFSFAYPGGASGADHQVLHDVDLTLEEGAFCVVSGPTGCGKTTLLRSLKPELAPRGKAEGIVRVLGCELAGPNTNPSSLPSAGDIGFVSQDPAAQVVCDTVLAELAFGLENAGCDPATMRRRVAEVASFLGIEHWLHRRTADLSGGHLQLLNLASALALRPRLLVMDEPLAQLDPRSRDQLLMLLGRVNRELGVAVICSSHAPELFDGLATQRLELEPLPEVAALPEGGMATWGSVGNEAQSANASVSPASVELSPSPIALELRDVRFRYGREEPWVLRGIDLQVRAGQVHALVGGNGCGKTTLLRVMAGVERVRAGKVARNEGRLAYLPQDPKALLVCDSVAQELSEWRPKLGYSAADETAIAEQLGLSDLMGRHPMDLSGGQQQLLALAKVLLGKPRILLLDEPAKGLDPAAAGGLVRELRSLAAQGVAVVLVTHDLDLACVCADVVSLLFDGELACTEPASAFFRGNAVYRPHRECRLFGALR